MGVVIEICIKYPGGRTRIRGTDIRAGLAMSENGLELKRRQISNLD